MNTKEPERIPPHISPMVTAHQIPILPMKSGNKNKKPIWNINVLVKEMINDSKPLFKAVKKDEKKIAKPTAK